MNMHVDFIRQPGPHRIACALLLTLSILIPAAAASHPHHRPAAAAPNLAQRLGYPADTRLIIVHADDAGVTHSVDRAIESAFRQGVISSSSILVAAPWFPEIAAFARTHPQYDFGVHLDLTAEWQYLRWRGVAPSDQIPSLLDPQGFLWRTTAGVARHDDAAQADRELRAQIERAKAFGIPITHLDTHMAAVLATPALAKVYLKLGHDYHLPILVWPIGPDDPAFLQPLAPLIAQDPNVFLSGVVMMDKGPLSSFPQRYADAIRKAKPGTLTQIIIHPGIDGPELEAAMGTGAYGATWRQTDYNIFTSPAIKKLMQQEHVQLIRWKQLWPLLK